MVTMTSIAVVTETRRGLEGIRRPLGEDRGRGQRHLHTRGRGDVAQGTSSAAGRASHTWHPALPAYAGRAPGQPQGTGCRYRPLPCQAWESLLRAALYQCSECGWQSTRWAGRCGECQQWGTVVEARVPARDRLLGPARSGPAAAAGPPGWPARHGRGADRGGGRRRWPAPGRPGWASSTGCSAAGWSPARWSCSPGEPGVGKSTLLLEAGALAAATGPVLYVTGEESAAQVRLRADRIGAISQNLYLAAETDFGALLEHVDAVNPALLIVDSVQTISAEGVDGAPGGVTQVREVTCALTALAKQRTLTTVLVGHVTKDGSIAGPRSLEHLVDVVLHFDGDRHAQLRMVRALKNRFGPTDEIGCFELGEYGLTELPDPSGLFLSRLRDPVPGTCVTVTLEGRRPLLAEVQTLVCERRGGAAPPGDVGPGLIPGRHGAWRSCSAGPR